jgi:hypothetical protein
MPFRIDKDLPDKRLAALWPDARIHIRAAAQSTWMPEVLGVTSFIIRDIAFRECALVVKSENLSATATLVFGLLASMWPGK